MRRFTTALLCAIVAPVVGHTQGVCALTSPTIKGRLVVMVRTHDRPTPPLLYTQSGDTCVRGHTTQIRAASLARTGSRCAELRRGGRRA